MKTKPEQVLNAMADQLLQEGVTYIEDNNGELKPHPLLPYFNDLARTLNKPLIKQAIPKVQPTIADAQEIANIFDKAYIGGQALLALAWLVGTPLKKLLGFYPNILISGGKASGKTTLLEALSRIYIFPKHSATNITQYRLNVMTREMNPVAIDEYSNAARGMKNNINEVLHTCYQHTFAPIAIASESGLGREGLYNRTITAPLESCRKGSFDITALPDFPYNEWMSYIRYIAAIQKLTYRTVKDQFNQAIGELSQDHIGYDDIASPILKNHAAILLGWKFLQQMTQTELPSINNALHTSIDICYEATITFQ